MTCFAMEGDMFEISADRFVQREVKEAHEVGIKYFKIYPQGCQGWSGPFPSWTLSGGHCHSSSPILTLVPSLDHRIC